LANPLAGYRRHPIRLRNLNSLLLPQERMKLIFGMDNDFAGESRSFAVLRLHRERSPRQQR
jgi:hypothetical protein